MAGSGATRTQKSCDACKRYLDHLDGKNQNVRSFLSPMTANSKHSMVVPKRFLKHFAGKLSGIIKLESPNRGSYDVEVTEHCNNIVFQHGWGQFVESHHIKENDYLLFRHIERSCFEVLILDSDGCEKVFPCAGISVNCVDISSSSHHEISESSASERFIRCQKRSRCCHGKNVKMAAALSSSEESGEDSLSGSESIQSDHVMAYSESNYVLSAQCHLTVEQKEKIVALVKKVQPEIPFLVIQMKKSNVNRLRSQLAICKGYAAQHFPQESQSITLECPGGKKWHPRLHVRADGHGYILTTRWQNFVRDNKLGKNDICLFQPMRNEKGFRVMVHLLCEPRTRSSSSGGHTHCLNRHIKRRVTSTARVHETSGSERGSLSFQKETANEAGTSSLYVESGEDGLSGNESIQSDHVKAFSERDYVLSARCQLTAEQEEKIVALVKKVQPEIPVLVVQMKKSIFKRLNSSLVICKGYAAQYFPQESQHITLECPGGKKWRSRLNVRPDGCGYILTAQWQNIVRDNRLQKDDICLFQPMPNEKGFRVMVHLLCEPSTHSSSSDGHAHVLRSHMERGVTSTTHVHEKSGSEHSESIRSDHVKEFSERNYVLSARCHLTAEQKEKIVVLVKKVQPEIPILVVQMKKSNVNLLNSNLVICKDYAAQHFPQESQLITLERPGGKRWRTGLHVRPGGCAFILITRWRDFVRDNHLQKGDICLFQPMPSEKGFRVMVHLLSDPSTRSSSFSGHAHGLRSHIERGVTSTVNIHEKSGSENSGPLELHTRQAVQQGHQVLSDCGGPSKLPLYVVLGGTCLTPAQDKVVQEKAMAIKAEVSIFVVTMNKKILGYNNEAFILDWSDAAEYLPDGEQTLTLRRQGQGRAWHTNLQDWLMLATGEWREFVRDSGLEDGDICLFEPMKNERLAMLVHIIPRKHYS